MYFPRPNIYRRCRHKVDKCQLVIVDVVNPSEDKITQPDSHLFQAGGGVRVVPGGGWVQQGAGAGVQQRAVRVAPHTDSHLSLELPTDLREVSRCPEKAFSILQTKLLVSYNLSGQLSQYYV